MPRIEWKEITDLVKATELKTSKPLHHDLADIYMDEIDNGLKEIDRNIKNLDYPHTQTVQIGKSIKCPYCGQYGILHSQCEHCGAPIDEN